MPFNEKIIEEKIEKKIQDLGYALVKVGFFSSKKRKKIEVVIYSPNGIRHTDCAKVTKELLSDEKLAEEMGENYLLEISSPGINRKLFSLKEYSVFKGKRIEYFLRTETSPKIGKIEGVEGGKILLYSETDRKKIETPLENIHYSKLTDEGE